MALVSVAQPGSFVPIGPARSIGLAGRRAAAFARQASAFALRPSRHLPGLGAFRFAAALSRRFGVRRGQTRWARLHRPDFVFLRARRSWPHSDAWFEPAAWPWEGDRTRAMSLASPFRFDARLTPKPSLFLLALPQENHTSSHLVPPRAMPVGYPQPTGQAASGQSFAAPRPAQDQWGRNVFRAGTARLAEFPGLSFLPSTPQPAERQASTAPKAFAGQIDRTLLPPAARAGNAAAALRNRADRAGEIRPWRPPSFLNRARMRVGNPGTGGVIERILSLYRSLTAREAAWNGTTAPFRHTGFFAISQPMTRAARFQSRSKTSSAPRLSDAEQFEMHRMLGDAEHTIGEKTYSVTPQTFSWAARLFRVGLGWLTGLPLQQRASPPNQHRSWVNSAFWRRQEALGQEAVGTVVPAALRAGFAPSVLPLSREAFHGYVRGTARSPEWQAHAAGRRTFLGERQTAQHVRAGTFGAPAFLRHDAALAAGPGQSEQQRRAAEREHRQAAEQWRGETGQHPLRANRIRPAGQALPYASHQPEPPALEALFASPAALAADLQRRGGPGVSVSYDLRQRLAGTLGVDPSQARLHRNPVAAAAARRLRAEAFTIGRDVFFGEGQGETTSRRGLALLAHELTHVGQQARLTSPQMQFWTPQGGSAMEIEAQHVARRVQEEADGAAASLPPGQEGVALHRPPTSPRPSLSFVLPAPDATPRGPQPPSQTAAGARTGPGSKPSAHSAARCVDARAVADRVYELMRQDVIQARRRSRGL